MRSACSFVLFFCAVLISSRADAQQGSSPLFIKFGGQIRDDGRVLAPASKRSQPLVILEQNADSLRVQLQSGAGWIARSDVGTREEVLKDASQRIASDPSNIELRLYRLELLSSASAADRTLALADLEHVISLAPQDPRGYFLRGTLLAKSRHWDASIDDFSRCLKLDPKLAAAHLERGLAYYAVRDFDSALADLDALLKLEPKSADALAARGMTHVELQKYPQAEADFAEAIKLDDRLALPWFERARMWMRRHQAAAAVNDLSETLKRDGQHLDATLFLATLLACGPDNSPRDGKRAIELALAAGRLADESDHRPIEALAAAHAETGDFPKAIEQQERALALLAKAKAPEGPKAAARHRLSQYKAGQPVRLMR